MITPDAILQVLQRYSNRYRYLDVFAADLEDRGGIEWLKEGDHFISNTPVVIRAQALTPTVIRFSLVDRLETPLDFDGAPMLLGAVVGGLIGAASKKEGAILVGMGIGLLIGALASADGTPRMNRVMALRYDEGTRQWRVLEGPLLSLAKKSLVASEGSDQ